MRNDQQIDAMDVRTERLANQAPSSSTLASQAAPVQVERTVIQQVISTAGVSSITGTSNQVIASAAIGAVTLSLPQSIGTGSSPAFADLILSAPTKFGYLLAAPTLNLNTNTKQTLYTVPAGKSAIILEVVLRSASVDLSGGATGNISLGFNAGATDWANPAFGTAGLTASAQFVSVNQFAVGGGGGGPSIIGTATQIFGAITDVAFGSAASVIVEVFGHLF